MMHMSKNPVRLLLMLLLLPLAPAGGMVRFSKSYDIASALIINKALTLSGGGARHKAPDHPLDRGCRSRTAMSDAR